MNGAILAALISTLVPAMHPSTKAVALFTKVGLPVAAAPSGIEQAKKTVLPGSPEMRRVDLQVVGGDLPVLLRTLSERSKVGLVLLGISDAKVTTNLVNVTFIDALRHLCAIGGLRYLKVGTTYVVAGADRLKEGYPVEWERSYPTPSKPPVVEVEVPAVVQVTEVFRSNYVSANQLAEALKSIYGEKLTAIAGPVQDNPSVTGQRVENTTGSTSLVIEKQQGPAAGTARVLVLRGPRGLVDEALSLARSMDQIRAQVAIEVTIHDIADSALKELGVSWSFGNIEVREQPSSGVNIGSFTRGPQSFVGAIKALETQDKAKLLASPNISVLDGERAFILIGDRLNFPVLVGFGSGNTPIFSKEEERVGIYLQVAASISSDDQITLSLYPQVSSVSGFLNVNGASYPQISTREAQTTLRVRSGETIVMGGLLKTDETRQVEKVPILGDLPFLGELFRRRKTTRTNSQVIISITPRVIPVQ